MMHGDPITQQAEGEWPEFIHLLDEYFKRYGITRTAAADLLNVSPPEMSAFMKSSRRFQRSHIAALIEFFDRFRSGPLTGRGGASRNIAGFVPWTRSDEFFLLWTYVHGERPKLDDSADVTIDRGEFTLGGHRQDAIIYEFNQAGYDRSLLSCSFEASPLRIPTSPDLAAKFPTLQAREAAELRKRPRDFEGSGLTLSYIHSTRTKGDERPQLTMRFKPSDYIRRLTTRALFHELSPERRASILATVGDGIQEEYCGGFGAVISIITADRKLLFFKRSKDVGGDRGRFDCTITESADGMKDLDAAKQPSPIANAFRGLFEEAGLKADENNLSHLLKLHGIVCRSLFYEWAIYGSLDLSGTSFTAERLVEGAVRGLNRTKPGWSVEQSQGSEGLATSFLLARDSFEFQTYTAVPFNRKDVIRFIATQPVADYAFVNAVMTLASVLNVNALALDQELRLYPPFEKRTTETATEIA